MSGNRSYTKSKFGSNSIQITPDGRWVLLYFASETAFVTLSINEIKELDTILEEFETPQSQKIEKFILSSDNTRVFRVWKEGIFFESVQIRGPNGAKGHFLVEEIKELRAGIKTLLHSLPVFVDNYDLKRVFLVHGHDEAMKQSVARVVEKLGLETIILHEQPNRGRTIIEKFTDYSHVGFAVILLSPDDIGYDAKKQPTIAQARARQNVILEMGFFLGKLGRERVFVLYPEDGSLELPSDYSGVLYTKFDSAGNWKFELVKELQAVGYDVDANKLVRGN